MERGGVRPKRFEACSRVGFLRIPGQAAKIFENLVGREEVMDLVGTSSRLRAMKKKQKKIKREFDPGSESTLAARLTHASRTRKGSNP
jgi:hypothetical protein